MEPRKSRREPPPIDDTVIMENPGVWEDAAGDSDVGYEGDTTSETRPPTPPPLAA